MIVPIVTDNTGAALIDVKVKVDGEALTTRLDGRPLAVDPGEHEFAFSARVGPWPGRDVSTTQTMADLARTARPDCGLAPAPERRK